MEYFTIYRESSSKIDFHFHSQKVLKTLTNAVSENQIFLFQNIALIKAMGRIFIFYLYKL